MSTITKEWLQQKIADMEAIRDDIPFGLGEDGTNTLAALRIALASLEAEAVGEVVLGEYDDCGCRPDARVACIAADGQAGWENFKDGTRLYTSPPAPVSVPDAMEMDDDFDSAFEHGKAVGWNACRAAMLQGAEPVKNHDELREKVRREHAEWSQATFGDVGPVGSLKHLSKEALEAASEPRDLSEWADMQFLLWDAQRRAGISDGEITAAMEEKLKVNMARQWPEPKDGEPRLHIKAAPQQEVMK